MAVTDETLGRRLWSDLKAQAAGMAKLTGPGANQKRLTDEEERLLFMKEADGWTPEKELQLLAEGKSRQEIGNLKYPHRMKLAASGERALSKYAQSKYLADMARKIDPTWAPLPVPSRTPTALAPAPPEASTAEPAFPMTEIGG